MLQIAIVAGGICAVIVAAYFIAIDQYRAATASGGLVAGAPRQAFVKQLEAALRPVSHLPAGAAIQLRQKLSQAGNQIGRASWRERGWVSGVAGELENK